MELLTGILSAGIAAIISLVVAVISFIANKNVLKSEREKFERELQRNMTTKLYDARLEVYPEAIAITDRLRKSQLQLQGKVPEAYFKDVVAQLDEWHSTRAFLLLSRNAVHTFYRLRYALREVPQPDGTYSEEQINQVWKAKGAFRMALRSDIQLLYQEEADLSREE